MKELQCLHGFADIAVYSQGADFDYNRAISFNVVCNEFCATRDNIRSFKCLHVRQLLARMFHTTKLSSA